MATKISAELTLRDRLSRLDYLTACKLLGPEGPKWIQRGGRLEIDIAEHVYFGEDLFRVSLPAHLCPEGVGGIVTLTLMAETTRRLKWNCNTCEVACIHAGAAFSMLLEDKTALGLAAAPPELEEVATLSDVELVAIALREREERAHAEKMTVESLDPSQPWAEYLVRSHESGKTYRVSLRSLKNGDSFCSCPDYRKNTLGTCKHIFNVIKKVRRRFPETAFKRPFVRKALEVHLKYGPQTEILLGAPKKLSGEARRIVEPVLDKPISDLQDLMRRLAKLEAVGETVSVFPDAEELINIQLEKARLSNLVREIRKNPAAHGLRRSLLKVELLPYQLDGIAFAVGAGRAVLADEMGLGKTIQGIGMAELLAREAGIKKVLVVTPASVKSQWQSEVRKFADRDVQMVLGGSSDRPGQYANNCFFTICNYEQTLRDILAIEKIKWDLIILDEGQRIKNWEAKTARVIKGLKSTFALVLSGTPLENRLDELFSVVEFVDDRRLGPAFRFFNRHGIIDEKGKVLGYRNLAELRENLHPVLLRRTRDSVLKELPPRTTEILRIAATDEQLELHRTHMQVVSSIANKPFITEMDLLRLRKALLMCRMSADSTYLVDKQKPGYSSKLEALDDLICKLFAEPGRKAILFSEWTTMLGLIEPILKKHQLGYVRLDGSIPQKQRQILVNQFQTDPACRLFITTNAGSVGLNLQAADTVINVDLPWNPAILEQRIGRAHRMGQKRPVHVHVLITEGTVEESLLNTLSAKKDLALAALDASSDVDKVNFVSNSEELKRRLEILLGAKPEAEVDESLKRDCRDEAEKLAAREKLSAAGGQLITAAFQFLSEALSVRDQAPASQEMAAALEKSLADSLVKGADGKLQLTWTLPDASALKPMASALAHLLATSKS